MRMALVLIARENARVGSAGRVVSPAGRLDTLEHLGTKGRRESCAYFENPLALTSKLHFLLLRKSLLSSC